MAHLSSRLLVELYQQGRFPFYKPVKYYEGDIEQAFDESTSGEVVKPILRVSH